ncbi:tRNA(Ile)-lysidine synthase [Parafannyhessea umbonata]|uniref:tRNA(Ile)-lysidine synthase n=1 Tax=Parafannyhessea umbonata TaxID=604330 RepID=A0A1H1NZ66_9ACTN|nr:tRNA lysidine(34) synthetase TilS [Parafannyhessea umbonata]SDS03659.1 tRNA(Ile)-lysidine synthase [Parafannyhessea umbonata]
MPSVSRRFARTDQRFLRPSSKRDDSLRAPVVLMVSGGADSTALLLLAATSELDIDDGRGTARIARERLHVLHVNHGLRGLDAQEDEEFVRELSARFGIPCTVRRVDVAGLASEEGLGQQAGSNVENVGREVRYREATELANRLCREVDVPRSAARILTAHTADDRAETFLMNAIRGSGPSGLSSIPRRRNRIVRPLLDRTHEELCDLLRMRGIVWREDRTNADTRYLRAFVRHEVMPLLRERNPRLTSGMSASCDILSDEDAYMNQVASRTYRELMRRSSPTMVALDGARLAACEVAIARRVVRKAMLAVCPDARLEARHINRVLSLVAAGSGSASTPMGCDARMEYGLLFVRAQGEKSGPLALWLDVPGSVSLPDGRRLSARLAQVPAGSSPEAVARAHAVEWDGQSVLLDAEACGLDLAQGGRLWVDAAAPGDVMCPLGMHGQSKKLSDLLNEAKVPAADRPQVPVVRTSPTGAVVWVAGIRPDERVRTLPRTRLLLELGIGRD